MNMCGLIVKKSFCSSNIHTRGIEHIQRIQPYRAELSAAAAGYTAGGPVAPLAHDAVLRARCAVAGAEVGQRTAHGASCNTSRGDSRLGLASDVSRAQCMPTTANASNKSTSGTYVQLWWWPSRTPWCELADRCRRTKSTWTNRTSTQQGTYPWGTAGRRRIDPGTAQGRSCRREQGVGGCRGCGFECPLRRE